jgi:phosphoribosylformimino-5-aminoimidazole carboxamide ribonucleotide (ProFAR) isomerase
LTGACALETGDLADAQTQYEQSLKLAENWISQVFALVGLVRVHARENAAKELNRRGQQLVDVTEWQALFPDLRSQVEMALDAAEENSASEDWYQTAREHLRRMNEGPN